MRTSVTVCLLAAATACRKSPPPVGLDAGALKSAPLAGAVVDAAVVAADAERTESQAFALETSDAGAREGSVRSFTVLTEPPGALVMVNHREVGRSPVSFDAPSNSVWGLMVELRGYASVDRSIWPQPKPSEVLRFELQPIPVEPIDAGQPMVTLEVDSFPYGFLLVDEVDAGLTPTTIQLTPGPHELRVLRAACVPYRESINASPGETRRVFGKLICGP